MDIKQKNVTIFNDTQSQISKSKILTEAVTKSIASQKFYEEHEVVGTECKYPNTTVKVSKRGSFDAARSYGGKVCVLNFASATNPGGGVLHGSSAQEECLCRCSTLYGCLSDQRMMNAFYNPHRESLGPLHNNDIIYTPDVYVIKSDSYTNLYQPKVLDVITCAAPNLRAIPGNQYNSEKGGPARISDKQLFDLHYSRARRIMEVANANGAETLILGAFGCGAFQNDPSVVARAMKKAVDDFGNGHFVNIDFAIFCRTTDTRNYDEFKKVFG